MPTSPEVLDAFLDKVDSWRDMLAGNIALRNKDLSQEDLNSAVGRTISRLVFLRICRQRGIEPYGRLQSLWDGAGVYDRLVGPFRRADELNHRLLIDDHPLKTIVKGLCSSDDPDAPSLFSAETLGRVHERFLGKAIRLTRDRRVVVEADPGAKKAGGVYYTPGYVVDYIVRQAVGRKGEGGRGKAEGGGRRVRVLDPACGSGWFLIRAYEFLLEWYRQWYVRTDPEKYARGGRPRLCRDPGGDWRLTAAERKRILLANIHGVDVDRQAVEVTRLALLLVACEGQRRLPRHECLLNELSANVKCGNALTGPDLDRRQPDPPDRRHIHGAGGFDWRAEFPAVFEGNKPGFDAVIGNPPYRRELGHKHLLDEIALTDFGKRNGRPRMDLWYYFAHRGLELLEADGILSFIVSAYWTAGTGAEKLIRTLRETVHVDELFCLGKLKVFSGVAAAHMIMCLSKRRSERPTKIKLVGPTSETSAEPFLAGRSPVLVFEKTRQQLFRHNVIDLQPPAEELMAKLDRHEPLSGRPGTSGRLGIVRQGIAENPASINAKTNRQYADRWRVGEGVFALRAEEVERLGLSEAERKLLRPYHDLCDVGRYRLAARPSLALIYSTRHTSPDIDAYPRIREHLSRFRAIMEKRRETRKGTNRWWHLHWPRDERLWEAPKILSVQMAARPTFVPAFEPTYVPFSMNVFVPPDAGSEHLNYICGLLNSRLTWKWLEHHAKRRGVGLEINGRVLSRVPVRRIDFSDRAEVARHDRMVRLVEEMLSLHGQLHSAGTAGEKAALQRRINAIDHRIDRLVYELYDLTGEEIAVVEEATGRSI